MMNDVLIIGMVVGGIILVLVTIGLVIITIAKTGGISKKGEPDP